jgi:hypothetical protein
MRQDHIRQIATARVNYELSDDTSLHEPDSKIILLPNEITDAIKAA